MKSTRDEVLSLVGEINEAELAQKERFARLYRMMRDRTGARFVKFGNSKWGVNEFQPAPEYISFPRFLETMNRSITEIEPGQDSEGEARDESHVHQYVRSGEEAERERAARRRAGML